MTTCKNCNTQLEAHNLFCPACGAKIIKSRLTFSSVLAEFSSILFSWDNTFFKTFWHLFSKPNEVIAGYITGVRRRYMQPFAYMIVSLTIYGIYMYFAKDEMLQFLDSAQKTGEVNEFSTQYYNFIENILFNNFNILSFITIPITALFTLLIFRKKPFNFLEHNIIFTYTNAQYNLIAVILGLLGLLLSISFTTVSLANTVFLFLYYAFIFKKIFNISWLRALWKILLFMSLIMLASILLGIVAVLIYVLVKKQFN